MLRLNGYHFNETVYDGEHTVIYRGFKASDQQPVAAKVLKAEYPTPEVLDRFEEQYHVAGTLNLPGVVKFYALETIGHRRAIIMEDFGAISLADYLAVSPLEIQPFLELAVALTEIVGDIHRHRIIHKDINPRNILINPDTQAVKLIDFGLAAHLTRNTQALAPSGKLEGTLAYISPEQTGRMNRPLDQRTDLYALGVTLYEMLTGQVPFQHSDPLELVHSHIAKAPLPPHELKPEIPRMLSDILLKLLAKNARDRYQTAYGLQADLTQCLTQYQRQGTIERFSLGQADMSDRFQIPHHLYGRQHEVATLTAAFDRISAPAAETAPDQASPATTGQAEMILVAGYSGIGKSALVDELRQPVVQASGYFIGGKFDQLKRNIPYSAFIQTFGQLMRQLFTESEAQLATWKERLLAALGPNGQVIIDVIPEVALLLGPQPPVQVLGPLENQNRFNLVFQNFIGVFTQPEHPLVIFLDDLQWADGASLKLLNLLLSDPPRQHLLLLGAYRDNEIDPAHPLMVTLHQLHEAGARISTIALGPLTVTHVNALIADTLHAARPTTEVLAELVYRKTQGNPFFTNQFLSSLYQDGLVTFDYHRHVWRWEMAHIDAQNITDNVVDLMTRKLERLPAATQTSLKSAACIGNRFDVATLAIITEQSVAAIEADLETAVQEDVILPLNDTQFAGEAWTVRADIEPLEPKRYRFLHDRVQQAAYALIDPELKKVTHLTIGRLLLANASLVDRDNQLFDIVNQLNQGLDCIQQTAEQIELAELNLLAGQKAKASAAYEPAFQYLSLGLSVLRPESWAEQYDLMLALHVETAEVAYLSGEFDEMERLVECVLQHASTLLDKVKVYEVRIQAYVSRNQMLKAVHTGLPVLKLLGVRLPAKPNQMHIVLGLMRTKLALFRKGVENVSSLPDMTDPHALAANRILSTIGTAAYFAVPNLMPLIPFNLINLSLKYGIALQSAFGYAAYGLIHCGVLGDIDTGYQFGQLALRLLERSDEKKSRARSFHIVQGFIRHWAEPIRDTLEPLLHVYQLGRETGDLEYATYGAVIYCYNSYFIGRELTGLEQELASYNAAIEQLKQQTTFYMTAIYWQAVLNLLGRAENPCQLCGDVYDEEEMLPRHLEANDRGLLCYLYLNKLILCYLFQAFPQAIEHAVMTEEYLDGVTAMLVVAVFHFYDSLARLAVFPDVPRPEQKRILKKVAANQKKMKKWAHHAPMNHQNKYELVEAERARVLGQPVRAMAYYDRAIATAQENNYGHEEALACELAARYYLEQGQTRVASLYLRDAHYAYQGWGAAAKVIQLEETYPQLLSQATPENRSRGRQPLLTTTTTFDGTNSAISSLLDLSTVMKASQTISEEINLDKLLLKMMRIVIENTGAQRGMLILHKEDQLLIEVTGDQTFSRASLAVAESPDLAHSIVNYVAHTQEQVVLDNAAQAGTFRTDPYIVATRPKSILCFPILYQRQLFGLLYLENNLTPGTFTAERLEVLQLLSAQMAISIENATHYANLEEMVTLRTAELRQAHAEILRLERDMLERQMAGGFAHEMRNALSGAKMLLESVVSAEGSLCQQNSDLLGEVFDQIEPELSAATRNAVLDYFQRLDEHEEHLDQILSTVTQSTTRAMQVTNLILAYSKLGRTEPGTESVTLTQVLESIVQAHQPIVADAKIAVRLQLAGTHPLVGYEAHFHSVFNNLVRNACEALAECEGERERWLDITLTEHDQTQIVHIRDTANGIPKEHLPHLFEPFFSTKPSTGTGLGLNFVAKLVAMYDGTIEVESDVGQGTTFIVTFPVHTGHENE